jgi:predicted phage tail component-like protein
MAAPRALNGAPTTITVDGVDLHTYGVTITSVDNPLPPAIESSVSILGRDGVLDFTKNYGARTMTIQGDITADSHSLLMGYIDSLNALFRLRERGETFKVIFSDQSDRYWTCRFDGFSPKLKTLKNYGRTANFTLSFKLAKPYAEATQLTRTYKRLSNNTSLRIDYPGSIKTPINLNISPTEEVNLLDIVTGLISSENYLAWTYYNATGSNNSTDRLYGTNSVQVSRSSAGEYYAEIDVTSLIDTSKNYVFSSYCINGLGILNIFLDDLFYQAEPTLEGNTGRTELVVTSAMLSGVTSIRMQLWNDGSQTSFSIDGAFCYELQACDTDGDLTDFVAPPYKINSTLFVNPQIELYNGRNIYPYNNTEEPNANEFVAAINDPIGSSKVFILQSADNTTKVYNSAKVDVIPGKYYRVSFEAITRRYVSIGSPSGLSCYVNFENELGESVEDSTDISTETMVWQPVWFRIQAPQSKTRMFFELRCVRSECKLFFKNIMIYEESSPSESFLTEYIPPNKRKQAYTGSFYEGSELTINNENLTVDASNLGTESVANGMSGFSGDRLELSPGINYLRLRDARTGAANPESASTGTCACWISYRARFL